jgi:hypothetical protein
MHITTIKERKNNKTSYAIGDLLIDGNSNLSILAQVECYKVCAIDLRSGNRIANPLSVKDVYDISIKELSEILTFPPYNNRSTTRLFYGDVTIHEE